MVGVVRVGLVVDTMVEPLAILDMPVAQPLATQERLRNGGPYSIAKHRAAKAGPRTQSQVRTMDK